MKSEFDKAEQLYEKLLQNDETQAEAYWGLILCKYGIEYVEDPVSFKRIPTCHRASFESVSASEDYRSALSYADAVQRTVYETEAKEIDRLQKEILALSEKEKPYDVHTGPADRYRHSAHNGRHLDVYMWKKRYHFALLSGLRSSKAGERSRMGLCMRQEEHHLAFLPGMRCKKARSERLELQVR